MRYKIQKYKNKEYVTIYESENREEALEFAHDIYEIYFFDELLDERFGPSGVIK